MKISLLHNPTAGNGTSFEELRQELRGQGYEVVEELDTDADLRRALAQPVEFVAVAGGDGTVRKAARALAGRGVALGILPVGTANNIAGSLGIQGSVGDVIRGWATDRRVTFDMGVTRGRDGESLFLEGVGGGLVPASIAAAERRRLSDQKAETALARALETYHDTLSQLEPRPWTITLDDRTIEGEYLMLEVLNIPWVGPNLALVPDANPADGLFDLVFAEEGHRQEVAAYFAERIANREPRLSLPTFRGRRLEIRGCEEIHVDDEVRRGADSAVTIEVLPGAVEFLA